MNALMQIMLVLKMKIIYFNKVQYNETLGKIIELDNSNDAEEHYMEIARVSTIIMMFCAIGVTLLFN